MAVSRGEQKSFRSSIGFTDRATGRWFTYHNSLPNRNIPSETHVQRTQAVTSSEREKYRKFGPELARAALLGFKRELSEGNKSLKEFAIPTPEKFKRSVEIAQRSVARIAKVLNLPIQPGGLDVSFLTKETFDLIDKGSGALGFCEPLLDSVVVEYDEERAVIFTSIVIFHELFHKVIDWAPIFFSLDLEGEENVTFHYWWSRSGIQVNDISQGGIAKNNLINEVGNQIWERWFLEQLLKDEQFVSENQTELQQWSSWNSEQTPIVDTQREGV